MALYVEMFVTCDVCHAGKRFCMNVRTKEALGEAASHASLPDGWRLMFEGEGGIRCPKCEKASAQINAAAEGKGRWWRKRGKDQ